MKIKFFLLYLQAIIENPHAMKLLRFAGILSAIFMAVSCNDTNAIYSEIPVNSAPDAPPVSGQFNKNVLLEDYTGTWCGNCTRVAWGIERVVEHTERAVVVAIHNGNDPYHFADYMPLKNMISPNDDLALPIARIDRTVVWSDPDVNTQEALNRTSNNCGLGIAMNSTVNGNQINLDVKVKFAQNYSGLKLVVYALEDHLVYKQANYSIYYPEVTTIHNNLPYIMEFEHNHVLRSSLTNVTGDPIPLSSFDQPYERNFTVAVPGNIENPANLSFVAIVTDANNNAINSRAAKANEEQVFQENP